MSTERNRTITRFTHKGKDYKIHERTNTLHDGTPCTRRFIVNGEGRWDGEANNVPEARATLDRRHP
jgi:hypothetical protein